MEISLKSNIWKLQAIKALRWFVLVMPIIVLFFQDNGLSIGWISDLYSLPTALALCGIIFLFWGCISLLLLHRHKAL